MNDLCFIYVNHFNVMLESRQAAKQIEKTFHSQNKKDRNDIFGKEVYNISPARVIKDLKLILQEALNNG